MDRARSTNGHWRSPRRDRDARALAGGAANATGDNRRRVGGARGCTAARIAGLRHRHHRRNLVSERRRRAAVRRARGVLFPRTTGNEAGPPRRAAAALTRVASTAVNVRRDHRFAGRYFGGTGPAPVSSSQMMLVTHQRLSFLII